MRQVARSRAEAALDAPGRMVQVENLPVNLRCTESGGPTVVQEAGLGDFSIVWQKVQRNMAPRQRVCSYDRPGLGWSGGSTSSASPSQSATLLRKLLDEAGEAGPFIVVGHSYGGLMASQFAQQNSTDVAGLVLVESAHPDQLDLIPQLRQSLENREKQLVWNSWLQLAGLLALLDSRIPGRGLEGDALQSYKAVITATPHLSNTAAEMLGFPAALAEAGRSSLHLRDDMPLAVIMRVQPLALPEVDDRDTKRNEEAWQEMQSAYVFATKPGYQIPALKSSHDVHLTEPDLVVRAVEEMTRHSAADRGTR